MAILKLEEVTPQRRENDDGLDRFICLSDGGVTQSQDCVSIVPMISSDIVAVLGIEYPYA